MRLQRERRQAARRLKERIHELGEAAYARDEELGTVVRGEAETAAALLAETEHRIALVRTERDETIERRRRQR